MWLLASVLPIDLEIMLGIGIVGFGLYSLWTVIRKLAFEVVYVEPNEAQQALVSDYFDQVDETQKKVKVSPLGVAFAASSIFLIMLVVSGGQLNIQFWISLIASYVVIGGIFFGFYISYRRNLANYMDYKVAKVEFYDSSYIRLYSPNDHLYRNVFGQTFVKDTTPYYVHVRFNGKKIKLRVSEHVYDLVTAESCGVGYLVKYRRRFGFYDVYDFVPECRKNRRNSR